MKRLDPVEVVAIAIPVLLQFAALVLFLSVVAVWAALVAGA